MKNEKIWQFLSSGSQQSNCNGCKQYALETLVKNVFCNSDQEYLTSISPVLCGNTNIAYSLLDKKY